MSVGVSRIGKTSVVFVELGRGMGKLASHQSGPVFVAFGGASFNNSIRNSIYVAVTIAIYYYKHDMSALYQVSCCSMLTRSLTGGPGPQEGQDLDLPLAMSWSKRPFGKVVGE